MKFDVLVLTSNIITAVSYFVLTFQLYQFATSAQIRELFSTLRNSNEPKKRKLFKLFIAVAALFAAFIALCGCTHGLNVLRHFFPDNDMVITVQTAMLVLCAVISLITAIASYRLFPYINEVLSKFVLNSEGNLQLAENFLVEIVEMVKESILVISENFVVTRCNEASKVLFCSPNLLGETVVEYIHPQDLHTFHDTVNRVLSSYSLTPVMVEYRIRQNTPVPATPPAIDKAYCSKRTSTTFASRSGSSKVYAAPDDVVEDVKPLVAITEPHPKVFKGPSGSTDQTHIADSAEQHSYVWVESTICKGMRINHAEDFEYDLKIATRNINDKKREALDHVQNILKENEERGRINAAKLRYVSCIAHDLKTPLQSFCFTLDLLQQSKLHADQREFVEQANVAVDLMKLTISQTMDISKALTGAKLMPRRTTVYLSSVLKRVMVIINGYGKEVPISFEISADVNDTFITDEEWLWQMLLNLLTNACKYTDKGGIRVLLSCVPAAQSSARTTTSSAQDSVTQDMLMVEVYDTGVGISSDKIEHVFDAFAQVQDGQVTGTGLGLFGVRTRAEGLKGTCGARHNTESSTGTGTVMWFTIPYLPDDSSDMRLVLPSKVCAPLLEPSSPVTPATPLTPGALKRIKTINDLKLASPTALARRMEELIRRRKLTAMVVDDTLTVRKLMEKLLLRMGFDKVECYENGSKGLDAMMARTVDIVFSDVQMPILTGPEMVSRFRRFEVEALQSGQRRQRQLIVAVTANGAEVGSNADTGFDTVCPKPMGAADIYQLIDKHF